MVLALNLVLCLLCNGRKRNNKPLSAWMDTSAARNRCACSFGGLGKWEGIVRYLSSPRALPSPLGLLCPYGTCSLPTVLMEVVELECLTRK